MRVSNLQAMTYKNSQCRAAWSGHCLRAAAPDMTVEEGEGAYCVTAFGKGVQAWQMSCDFVNVSNNRTGGRLVQNVEGKSERETLGWKWERSIWRSWSRTNDADPERFKGFRVILFSSFWYVNSKQLWSLFFCYFFCVIIQRLQNRRTIPSPFVTNRKDANLNRNTRMEADSVLKTDPGAF